MSRHRVKFMAPAFVSVPKAQVDYAAGRVESLLAARPDRSLDKQAILNAFPNESLRTIERALQLLVERGRIEKVPGGGWRIARSQKAGA